MPTQRTRKTGPRNRSVETPPRRSGREHTSGIDTVEDRQGPRNSNIDTPQQKYDDRREPDPRVNDPTVERH
ncbi:MAG TPA: hypothetical protein VF342_15595 [Alphaproteobacteria bacterium]